MVDASSAVATRRLGGLPLRAGRLASYASLTLVAVGLIGLARAVGLHGSIELHTLLETAAVLIAAAVGASALISHYALRDRQGPFFLVGLAFVGVAVLDGFHAAATSSWFASAFPSALPALIPWSWYPSRLFLVLVLASITATGLRGDHTRSFQGSERRLYLITAAFALASFAFVALANLPRAYFPELLGGRPWDLVIMAPFALVLASYLKRGEWRTETFEHWLVLSLVAGLLAQLVMSLSGGLFDTMFGAAHVLKLCSYTFVLVGMLASTRDTFGQVAASNEELRLVNERLERSNFSALVGALAEGLIIFDAEGRIVEINSRAAEMYGIEPGGAVGRRATKTDLGVTFLQPDGTEPRYGELPTVRAFLRGEAERNRSVVIRRPDGSVIQVRSNSAPIIGPTESAPSGVIVTYTDVSAEAAAEAARLEAEAEVRRLAFTDTVTGLANRPAFERYLEEAIREHEGRPELVVVMFLDLDRFKVVNDAISHAAGDDVLREAARRISGVLREGDLAARIGGDEFAIVLKDVADRRVAEVIARRVLEVFREPWRLSRDLRLTTSIGLALHPEDGIDASTLLQSADSAMYEAKVRGRDQCAFYRRALNENAISTLTIEADLANALKRDEFRLHYQPVVRVDSGEIVGAEALLRWRHPTRGLLNPQDFLGVAEESGLIVKIDQEVLRLACAQAREWQRAGLPRIRMATNLSARHFRAGEVKPWVARTLADCDLDPHDLQLEISESTVITELSSAATSIDEIRSLGVTVAVDDFGTGYSALSYLRHLPADALKIDRSFVAGLVVEQADKAIVGAVIALASSLGLAVIAEGVETPEQLAALRRLGCHEYQGTLFNDAMPGPEFAKRLGSLGYARKVA